MNTSTAAAKRPTVRRVTSPMSGAPRPSTLCLAIATALSLGIVDTAEAAVWTWTGATTIPGGPTALWSTAGNWSGASVGVPKDGDSLVYNGNKAPLQIVDISGATAQVLLLKDISFTADATDFILTPKASSPTTLKLSGNVSNLGQKQTFNVAVEAIGGSAEQIWNGGSNGMLLSNAWLSGSNTKLTLSNNVAIQKGGTIALGNLANESLNLNIKAGSSATLDILDIARGKLSQGTLLVDGNSSKLSTRDINIGHSGTGVLTVQNSAQVNISNGAKLGTAPDSKGTLLVSGLGSQFSSAGSLFLVGEQGSGSLTIENGGVASNVNSVIADRLGSTGNVVVTGQGSQWVNTASLIVGQSGQASLSILDSGKVTAQNLAIGARGVLTLDGGNLQIANASVASGGSFNWIKGVLAYTDKASLGSALLPSFSTLSGGKTLSVANALTIGGASTLNLSGGNASAGSLVLQGQAEVGSFSELSVGTGGMNSSGVLQLSGGTFRTAGAAVSSGIANGYGVITGSGGFNNAGLLRQGEGTLVLSNAGLNENSGTWDLQAGRTLSLQGADLNNRGSLNLNGGFISGTAAVVNAAQGSISGSGRISAGFSNNGSLIVDAGRTQIDANFVNRGQVLLSSNAANLAGGQIDNRGLIQGFGKINNNITQADATGRLEAQGGTLTVAGQIVGSNRGILAAGDGGKLLISQGLASNAGQIQLSGGTVDNNGRALVNEVGASINGFGTLRSGTLSNKGQILLSGGTSAVRADIVAQAGSEIVLSGQSNTSFYGSVEVMSDAELRVSEGSVATFAGLVKQRTGSNINGDGKMFFEGGLNIGNSPGYGYIQGSVVFASSNFYEAEIGGTAACTAQSCALGSPLLDSSFDKLVIGGNLRMGGTLTLKSWNGFVAQAGQSFDLLDWGSSSGTFKTINASGLSLAAGTKLDYSQLYTNGTITVTAVPEPESYALMLAGLGAIGFLARRRRAQAVA